jgi:hypothetical protein
MVLQSGQKLTLGLLATITLKLVPFARMHHSQCFCHFLNVPWQSCSVTGDSASITLTVSSQVSTMGGGRHIVFSKKFSGEKRKCETVWCHDARATSFAAKVWDKVFAHFLALRHHSSMWDSPFGLPGQILCEQSPLC